ncbi:RluA family pseudouridine synthase [Desulfosoma caldarium]|uniref:Pseudouridine synthase n=1 Tax=Desulfosoma caldarium TaxID=610254 RepID=A0A3N1UI83_9BACT|nr:RluA family pseudouridine synthase [Desulfosoma caldarium]ROQ90974.1 ribosomal large subunit pseudouridine synthase D [Desulfosoma caldarium]
MSHGRNNIRAIFHVQAPDKGRRLDVFLSAQDPQRSRSQYKKWIESGRVLVNGQRVKCAYVLQKGDEVCVQVVDEAVSTEIIPEPMPLEVLFEDEDMIVVNKPAGLVVHPGAGHATGTLVHGLLAHCSRLASQGAPLRPGIVHRLDQETSGVVVVAKSDAAYLNLIDQFKGHAVRKTYLAFVYGTLPQCSGEIRTLIGRHPTNRKKMAVVDRLGKEAVTFWQVRQSWQDAISLLEVRIVTGRTHQIRVHCQDMGHPVVGDGTYGGGPRRARQIPNPAVQAAVTLHAPRTMLHAWRMALAHPRHGTPMAFEAPVPADFRGLWTALQEAVASPS